MRRSFQSRRSRAGLTLVEVLAACALLVLIVAACLPLFAEARRYADATLDPDRDARLALTADIALTRPETLGLDAAAMVMRGYEARIPPLPPVDRSSPLPEGTAHAPADELVSLRLIEIDSVAGDGHVAGLATHAWLEFRFGTALTVRFVERPPAGGTRAGAP